MEPKFVWLHRGAIMFFTFGFFFGATKVPRKTNKPIKARAVIDPGLESFWPDSASLADLAGRRSQCLLAEL